MNSYDYIEKYKEFRNLQSDYGAAKELGISRAVLSLIKGGRPLSEDIALKIADEMGLYEGEIFAVIASEKAKTPRARKALLKLAKMSKQTGEASPNLLLSISIFSSAVVYCILC